MDDCRLLAILALWAALVFAAGCLEDYFRKRSGNKGE